MGNARSRKSGTTVSIRIPFPVRVLVEHIESTLGLQLGLPIEAKIEGLPEDEEHTEGVGTFVFQNGCRVTVEFCASAPERRLRVALTKLRFKLKFASHFKCHAWGMQRGIITTHIRDKETIQGIKATPGATGEVYLHGELGEEAISLIVVSHPDALGHTTGLNIEAGLIVNAVTCLTQIDDVNDTEPRHIAS